MTLVARITLGGAPFLIADALVSSENVSPVTGPDCKLPFIGEINSRLATTGQPFRVGLRQKLYVFEGRLALGWSGDALQAERALKALREIAKKANLSLNDVQQELETIDPDQIKNLNLIGLLLRAVDGNQISAQVFNRNAITKEVRGFGEVVAAGSGARTFIEMLEQQEPVLTEANDPWTVLGLLGGLLSHELSTGQSIGERWGGAYETISYSRHNRRLEKLDKVLHTFWSWQDDERINFDARFYLARYFDELLVLRSVEYEAGKGHSIERLKSDELTFVPSLLEADDGARIDHVDFSYDYICCHVGFGMPEKRKGALVLAGPKGGSYHVEVSVARDGSLRLRLPGDTVTNVLEAARAQAALFGL